MSGQLILYGGRPVASVEPDGVLLRWAGPNEMLRQPAAWAFHPQVLALAAAAGAHTVRVVLRDPPAPAVTYEAPLQAFTLHGLTINRGHGQQVALTLDWWGVNGEPSRVEQRNRPATAPATGPQQGRLW